MSTPSRARVVALDVLVRVEQERAYAPLALDGALSATRLSRRDRALATQLVYGVLRWQGRIDYYLQHFSHRPLTKVSPVCRAALRLAVYQTLFLKSVPPPVACSESVALVKAREPWAAGFVNALCRHFARKWQELSLPAAASDPVKHLAVVHSHPEWMVERWHGWWGFQETAAICQVNNEPAPVTIRVNLTRTRPAELAARLEAAGVQVEPGKLSPAALRLAGVGPVQELPGYAEGHFQVQDESSQLVAWIVDPHPGQRIIDLCAGPGGKSTHLAELALERAGESGQVSPVVSVDIHAHKIRLIEENARRLGLDGWIRPLAKDARTIAPEEHGLFDAVLVDAPCSGTGVLRRRPDLRWQRRLEDLRNLVRLQRELLAAAARLVKPGGALVYSTCSLEKEENEENARWFLERFPDFEGSPLSPHLPGPAQDHLTPGDPWLLVLPSQFGTDGFFIFRAVRLA